MTLGRHSRRDLGAVTLATLGSWLQGRYGRTLFDAERDGDSSTRARFVARLPMAEPGTLDYCVQRNGAKGREEKGEAVEETGNSGRWQGGTGKAACRMRRRKSRHDCGCLLGRSGYDTTRQECLRSPNTNRTSRFGMKPAPAIMASPLYRPATMRKATAAARMMTTTCTTIFTPLRYHKGRPLAKEPLSACSLRLPPKLRET